MLHVCTTGTKVILQGTNNNMQQLLCLKVTPQTNVNKTDFSHLKISLEFYNGPNIMDLQKDFTFNFKATETISEHVNILGEVEIVDKCKILDQWINNDIVLHKEDEEVIFGGSLG